MSRIDNDEWDAEGIEAVWARAEYRCPRCGRLRLGVDVALIGDRPYCHGSCDPSPTCFQIEGGL